MKNKKEIKNKKTGIISIIVKIIIIFILAITTLFWVFFLCWWISEVYIYWKDNATWNLITIYLCLLFFVYLIHFFVKKWKYNIDFSFWKFFYKLFFILSSISFIMMFITWYIWIEKLFFSLMLAIITLISLILFIKLDKIDVFIEKIFKKK